MKKLIIIIILVLTLTLIYQETKNEIIIPDASIRLRVIPNSNSSYDQKIKTKVKNYLEQNIYTLLKDKYDIEEARIIIKDSIPIIKENVDNIFMENNYNINYDINYGYNYFPAKEYKGFKYKEGYYESLVISIGNAEGDNWWCVLFPNLCFADLKEDNNNYKSWIKERINKLF